MSDRFLDMLGLGATGSRQIIFESQFLSPGTTAVSYDEMPRQYQIYLDDIAVTVFDPDGSRVIITGDSFSGKTFIIEQLYTNRDIFLKRSGQQSIEFVRVSHEHARLAETLPAKWHDYAQLASTHFNHNFEDIVFYTESVDAAMGLSMIGGRIILEVTLATLQTLRKHESMGVVKQWASWEIVDMNDQFLTKTDLIDMISIASLDKINTTYPEINMSKKHVALFVNYAVKNGMLMIDKELDPEHAGMIAVPPALMARAVGRLAAIAALSSDARYKNGNVNFSSSVRAAFDNFEGLFYNSLQNTLESLGTSENDFDEMEALRNMIEEQIPGVKIMSIRNIRQSETENEKEKAELSDLKFSDMKTLKERLGNVIIGQDQALEDVVSGLKIPAAGLNMDTRPLRSMLFLGPTGVGKTELSLTLAKELYEKPVPIKRIDMSEFGQEHEAAKLLGAPPGYVGHEAGGVLTNFVKDNPRSIVILDEIEKAHPKIWDSFLQILDAGRMTDGHGETVDFTKTIVIMTSNIGASQLQKRSIGFLSGTEDEQYAQRNREAADTIRKAVEEVFRPEMINRIDQQVVFLELPRAALHKLIAREIERVAERIVARGYILEAPKTDILDHIAALADTSKYGAREVQRVIGKNVYGLLADAVLEDTDRKNLKLILKDGSLKVQARKIGTKGESTN